MVKGLDVFRDRFREFEDSFVLIGGAACDEWFSGQGLFFRATRDLDLVLLVEALDHSFVSAFRQFIDDGGYLDKARSTGDPPILCRFAKPTNEDFPFMLEIFSRKPEGIDLSDDQTIVPLPVDEEPHSLSAILLDDDYYRLIREHAAVMNGLAMATVTALIPLKARAWIDLTERRDAGEKVGSGDIKKHRNDVFRLAATLPDAVGPRLPDSIRSELARFLEAFPEDSEQWTAIRSSIKATVGPLQAASLIAAVRNSFGLDA